MYKLSEGEIEQALKKLRTEYEEYGKNYSRKFFNREEFEKRYMKALRERINLSTFFLAEIMALEDLKKKLEDKKEKAKFRQEFWGRIDEILQENERKIAKYRELNFHDNANIELKKILFALDEFREKYFFIMLDIISTANDSQTISKFNKLRKEFNNIIGSERTGFAPRIQDHIIKLNRKPVDLFIIEEDNKNFLKEIAFLLNDISKLLSDIIKNVKLANPNEKYICKNNIFNGKSKTECIEISLEYINQVLSDFRLTAFKKKL